MQRSRNRKIFQYDFPVNAIRALAATSAILSDNICILMPKGAEVLHFACREDRPCIWAIGNPDHELVPCYFRFFEAGDFLPDKIGAHVGSFHVGQRFYHLFYSEKTMQIENWIARAAQAGACKDAIRWLRANPRAVEDIIAIDRYVPWALGALDEEATRILLDAGAKVNARDAEECTPLHWAAEYGHSSIARILLQHGADVDARDHRQRTSLHRAAKRGELDVARVLLDAGADVDARDDGQRTLHWAAECGHSDIARILLQHGADVDARDDRQRTPLHRAVRRAHSGVARVLLEAGTDVNARDDRQRTPLHWANYGVAHVLLKAGANVYARDDDGYTPLDR